MSLSKFEKNISSTDIIFLKLYELKKRYWEFHIIDWDIKSHFSFFLKKKIQSQIGFLIFGIVFNNILFCFYVVVFIASVCPQFLPPHLIKRFQIMHGTFQEIHVPLLCAQAGIWLFKLDKPKLGLGEKLLLWKVYGEGPMKRRGRPARRS